MFTGCEELYNGYGRRTSDYKPSAASLYCLEETCLPFDGVFLRSLVAEMQHKVVESRISRIQQPSSLGLVLKLTSPRADQYLVVMINPESAGIFLCDQLKLPGWPTGTGSQPRPFCMLLRKYIDGARILDINQRGFDRVVDIVLSTRNEIGDLKRYRLTLEIMGKHSNIILTDDQGMVLDAAKRVGENLSRVRQIYPGIRYTDPPSQSKIEPLAAGLERMQQREFWVEVLRDKLNREAPECRTLGNLLVKTVSGIGSHAAGHICLLAGYDPDINVEVAAGVEVGRIAEAITDFFDPVLKGEFRPVVYLQGETPADYYCFPLLTLERYSTIRVASPSQAAVEVTYARLNTQALRGKASGLKRIIQEHIGALERRLQALQEALRETAQSNEYRLFGEVLMAYKPAVHGLREIMLPNFYDPDCRLIKIPVDPALDAMGNAQKYFSKYHKAKRVRLYAEEHIRGITEELEYLRGNMDFLDMARTLEELDDIAIELEKQQYIRKDVTGAHARKKASKNKEPRTADDRPRPLRVSVHAGWEAWVGKNNRQNDYLLRNIANPDDLWLHAKDIPGSHVILRPPGKEAATLSESSEALEQAAVLAAFFSRGRHSTTVPVDYTHVKWVRKPKGAKPGFVTYTNQNTIYVRPDENRVREILGSKPENVTPFGKI